MLIHTQTMIPMFKAMFHKISAFDAKQRMNEHSWGNLFYSIYKFKFNDLKGSFCLHGSTPKAFSLPLCSQGDHLKRG